MLLFINEIIEKISQKLQPGDLILLYGPMGAGKTFFTKQLCASLGINKVQSPTFTLVNEYVSRDMKKKVLHTDLYRLSTADETIFEEIYSPEHICIIEWSERLTEDMIELMSVGKVYRLHFTHPGEKINFLEQ